MDELFDPQSSPFAYFVQSSSFNLSAQSSSLKADSKLLFFGCSLFGLGLLLRSLLCSRLLSRSLFRLRRRAFRSRCGRGATAFASLALGEFRRLRFGCFGLLAVLLT